MQDEKSQDNLSELKQDEDLQEQAFRINEQTQLMRTQLPAHIRLIPQLDNVLNIVEDMADLLLQITEQLKQQRSVSHAGN